jgi:hypothetical protein
LGVSALSDQLAAGAITMGERLGSDDAQVLNAVADSVPVLSAAVPLLAALRLPGSAHRWVSERTIGSRR